MGKLERDYMRQKRQEPTLEELKETLRAVDSNEDLDVIKGRKDTFGFVYFISDGEIVKIGVSVDPKRRLQELQTANHKKLSILRLIPTIDPYGLEAELHKHFADKQVYQEWYDILYEIKPHRDNYLTLKDIEKILDISHSSAYQLLRDPDFPAIRIGRSIRISESDFNNYMCLKMGNIRLD